MKKLSPATRRYLGLGFVVAFVLLAGHRARNREPGWHRARDQPGLRRRWEHQRAVHERLHRDLQPDCLRRRRSQAGACSTDEHAAGRTFGATPDQLHRARCPRAATTSCRRLGGRHNGVPLPDSPGHGRRSRWPPGPARSRLSTSTTAPLQRCSRLPARERDRVGGFRRVRPGTNCSETTPTALPHEHHGSAPRSGGLHRHGRQQRRLHHPGCRLRVTAPPPTTTCPSGGHDSLDQRRLEERGQRRHDDLHVHRRPLGAGRSQRRHLRHRHRGRHR